MQCAGRYGMLGSSQSAGMWQYWPARFSLHYQDVISVHLLRRLATLLARKSVLTLLSVGILLIILFFGLRPTTWPNINRVFWSAGTMGLSFQTPGFAYVKDLHTMKGPEGKSDFSICLGVVPVRQHPGFRPILMFHGGSDTDQLTIAQWNAAVIAMNGDDYSYRRKLPRIIADKTLPAGRTTMIGITSGAGGTILYANGRIVEEKKDLALSIPESRDKLRLILGNSVYGNHNWEGSLTRVAIYAGRLSTAEISTVCSSPSAAVAADPRLLLAYSFHQPATDRVPDISGHGQTLIIPSRPMALKQSFLRLPWPWFGFSWPFWVDVALNLFGFIPFGMTLYSRLRLSRSFASWPPVLATIIFCCGVSLLIELTQGWLPNRTSSLLDLILNSCGAMIGVLVIRSNWQRLRQMVAALSAGS